MGWVEGVAEIIKALAWPAVVLTAVLVLKREIGKLITRMTRLSGAGVEAEFGEQVEAAGDIAEAITADAPDELPATPGLGELAAQPTLSDLLEEAQVHPVGAMVRAWNIVEARIRRVTPASAKRAIVSIQLKRLTEDRLISVDLYALGRKLFGLRNQVVHENVTPSPEEAREFVTAAWRLASEFSRLPEVNDPDLT